MSTALAKPVSRPWRRYLRFSVRGLIVLVLVIGAWLGWLARSALIQRDAVAAITKAGGSAFYEEDIRGPTPANGRPANWVDFIRTRIDRNYFSNVVFVQGFDPAQRFDGKAASTDDGLFVHISHLKHVTTLNLMGNTVTDSTFARLKNLPSVETLMLQHTAISDSGLASLEGMHNLRYLLISSFGITDKGLEHVRGLNSLTTLSLEDSLISDAGMVHLLKLTKLSGLVINHTQVTDAGIEELKRALPNLKIVR